MNYKIVFSDIDGTLLNKDRKLSDLTKKVIRELNSQIPVILISSRMPQAMRHLQEQLHISHQPLICYNGGLILVDNKTVSSTEIPLEIVEELNTFNSSLECHLSLYHNEEWYVPQMDKWALREENNTEVTPTVLSNDKVIEKWKGEEKSAHKIMCMGEETHIDQIVDFLSANFQDKLHLYRSKLTYLEVASRKVSKLTAINQLLKEHFHYDIKEAIAFGDNFNDYEMLQAAGLGIAVGNAKPEILEIANEITHHGKEDGVAKSLQKLFKLS
ncbi:Cof-type HAD-IIB family hydrolase [Salinimicrobium gaetbulicola]|uniref:Cof-type HAD-IIB family hydrolase n=1 Tax=Salinimicrobium gaetbulicola TaxID=999702 RepID=A0ABW3IF98_9FLAO